MRSQALGLLLFCFAPNVAAQQIIEALDPSFGHALDLDGRMLAVGAPAYNHGQGGLWIYSRSGADWLLEYHTHGNQGDSLGYSLALDGRWILVGVPGAQRVCWFYLVANSRLQETCASMPRLGFGRAVAIAGIFSAVASPEEDRGRGTVDMFVQSGTSTWDHQASLVGEAEHSAFGATLAMNSELLLIGAPLADEPRGRDAGLVYSYDRTAGSDWVLQAVLTASAAGGGQQFGRAAALTVHRGYTYAVFGAPQVQASYLFVHTDSTWHQTDVFRPVPAVPAQNFGLSVALDQTTAVIGAPSGVPGQPGATWIMDIDEFHNWYPVHSLQKGATYGSSVQIDSGYLVVAEPGRAVYGYHQTALTRVAPSEMPPVLTAYPNPFREEVTLEMNSTVPSIQIWDITGRLITNLYPDGQPSIVWRPRNVAPGVYVAEAEGNSIQILYLP